jgi:predicted Zn-dependent peptidase
MIQFRTTKPIIWLRSSLTCLLLAILLWSFNPAIASSVEATPTKVSGSIQPYLDAVVKKVTKFSLNNGMKFIVLENHQAPVVSFVTYADVGGTDEPDGQTGVAHFLEHLAFKGTKRIGTTDYAQEKKLLDNLDIIYDKVKAAKQSGNSDLEKKLTAEFNAIETQAVKYVKQNEFGRIVETAGGVGLNAQTTSEATIYFYSFPANKLELWMSLESERFLEPVFREFYKEKEVILEERRLRTDNSPVGKTIEVFLDKAFTTHPYKRPVIGYDEDIRNLSRENVQQFFDTYYPPNNLTIAIAGDVDPQQVKKLADIYFGRYPSKPKPPKVTAIEPPQTEPREFTLKLPSQPWYFEGYHCASINDPDYATYQVMTALLSNGRTSRLYKSLVETKQVALSAEGFTDFPGNKYANLLVFYALTSPKSNVDEVAKALEVEIDKLKNELVSAQELDKVKTQLKADIIRSLDSNMGMTRLLVEYEVKTGDWRNIFKQLDALTAVTPQDIQKVSLKTFIPQNRTIGRIVTSTSQGS